MSQRRVATVVAVVAAAIAVSGCSGGGGPRTPGPAGGGAAAPPPELGRRAVASRGMVSAAHPRAAEAGIAMLEAGGNAVDAAVATAFAVSVGEPQMSGMGGGGSMLIWLRDEGRAEYVDFYASQPAAAFRGRSWKEDDPDTRLRIVAVPGEVAGLLSAHERFGRLPRERVVAPAIRLAGEGFPVNQVLARMIARDSAKLALDPDAASVFLPGGMPLEPGDLLRQPRLAESLRRVAEAGRDGFYRGPVAREVVAELREGGHPLSPADFAAYEARWKRPLCAVYRGDVVLSAPPPQTGLQVLHTLDLLEGFEPPARGVPTRAAAGFHLVASALRVGMGAGSHLGDPRWRDVPVAAVLSDGYVEERRRLVAGETVPDDVGAGSPDEVSGRRDAPDACRAFEPYPSSGAPAGAPAGTPAAWEDGGETTHISVVDEDGNAVALTQTNSSLFGSGARAAGFFLNNSGVDFARFDLPEEGELPGGEHGWITRRSTISPTVVLRGGDVRMVVGAPGGGRIPTAIVQAMLYHLDYGMDPLDAVRMPRVFPERSSPEVQLEHGFSAEVLAGARERGWKPTALSFGYARMYVIGRVDGAWVGAADPRHDGEVRGY